MNVTAGKIQVFPIRCDEGVLRPIGQVEVPYSYNKKSGEYFVDYEELNLWIVESSFLELLERINSELIYHWFYLAETTHNKHNLENNYRQRFIYTPM